MEKSMLEAIPTETGHFRTPDDYPITVLLVDDQAMVGEMIRRALANQPNLVFHYCSEAGDAMAYAERIHPTVILQDLLLPDVDGLTLVRQYRDNPVTRDVPIIVLSSKEEPVVKSEAFKQGATDYLVKLPDPIELVARIRHHSKAYLHQIQRNQAYRALHESQEQLVLMNIELQRLNNIDGLTGLSNRRYLDEFLTTEWKRALREQTALSVLMIDVDDFKRYNDTYGHLAGDEVLKEVATTITQGIKRPADLAARFGGEEFIVVLPNTEPAGAQCVAEDIRHRLENLRIPHSAATTIPYVTISVGTASMIPRKSDSSADLVAMADAALYKAKKAGRNRVNATLADSLS
jgi:two-component system, chemotaxis family, response regulator WspR